MLLGNLAADVASLSVAGMPLCCLPTQLDTVNAHNAVIYYFLVLSSQKCYFTLFH